MCVGVGELTPAEGKKLQRFLRGGTDPITYKRALVVLTSAQGSSIREIASGQLLSREYVRRIIHEFNLKGMALAFFVCSSDSMI